jgi:hypothetical protein
MGLEISAAYAKKDEWSTIASDEELGIGEKCDQDEYSVMKTNKPFADKTTEHGKEFFDVNGKILAIHPLAVNCGLIFSECSETSGSSLFKQQPLHLPAAHDPCNLSESEKR